MIYSYTQIRHYVRYIGSYCFTYVDDWLEKYTSAARVFGRCFENALAAYIGHQVCTANPNQLVSS
jgi:hypothetical protein